MKKKLDLVPLEFREMPYNRNGEFLTGILPLPLIDPIYNYQFTFTSE